MIYTKSQIVGTSVIDANAKLSYIGLFDVVEDAITEAMGQLQLDGITVKRKFNVFWVFTKNKIRLFQRPGWGDPFTVQSFVSSLSTAKMVVDTALRRPDGTLVAYSSCEMCLLDIATGRICRTSAVGLGSDFVTEPPQCDVTFDKLDDADLPQVGTVTVRSTNIDYSRHCNNVEYLRFLFNSYSVAELDSLPVSEIEVYYVAQSYEGDALSVHKRISVEADLLSVKRNGATVIKCRIRH